MLFLLNHNYSYSVYLKISKYPTWYLYSSLEVSAARSEASTLFASLLNPSLECWSAMLPPRAGGDPFCRGLNLCHSIRRRPKEFNKQVPLLHNLNTVFILKSLEGKWQVLALPCLLASNRPKEPTFCNIGKNCAPYVGHVMSLSIIKELKLINSCLCNLLSKPTNKFRKFPPLLFPKSMPYL